MNLPEIKQFDANQPIQNYFAARQEKIQEGRQKESDAYARDDRQNAIADRLRRREIEDEDRAYKGRVRGIEQDKEIERRYTTLLSQVDTTAEDSVYQEQVSQIPDMISQGMVAKGYSPEDIEKTISAMFTKGAFSKPVVKRMQMKMGLIKDSKNVNTPDKIEIVNWMVKSGIAKTPKEAYEMERLAKTNPESLIMRYVANAEDNQAKNFIQPGDPEYKDRDTLVEEAQDILQKISGGGESSAPPEPPMAVSHSAGGQPPPVAATAQPAPVAGSEPVPQTQAEFDALPAGTVYRDPDDGKLYRK